MYIKGVEINKSNILLYLLILVKNIFLVSVSNTYAFSQIYAQPMLKTKFIKH